MPGLDAGGAVFHPLWCLAAQQEEMVITAKLKEAAKKVEDSIEEALTYCDFPSEHWTRIRTNNVIERLNREIRRRPRVVGTFPDGNSALMLACAKLRHVAGTQWCRPTSFSQSLQTLLRIDLDGAETSHLYCPMSVQPPSALTVTDMKRLPFKTEILV